MRNKTVLSLRVKRSNLGIYLVFFLVVVFCGCATTPKSKPDLKDKSDKLFQELGKEETPDIQQNKEMKQMEKELDKTPNKSDQTVEQASRLSEQQPSMVGQPSRLSEEISFEETGEGFASKYERRIEAEKRAEENALSKALKKIGTDVFDSFSDAMAQSGKTQYQFVAKCLYIGTSGLVSYERTGEPIFTEETNGTKCVLKIKGTVYSKGKPDPSYGVKIDKNSGMDKLIYNSGDEVQLKFSVTKDSHITILNIDEEKNVYLIYPNKFVKGNILKAGESFEIPGNLGIKMQAVLQEGKSETVELLYIIATKTNSLFLSEDSKEILLSTDYTLFSIGEFKRAMERIGKLNRDEWTMIVLPYTIVKGK
ncbi:MAG: DUF4384 domain-containing protein [Candidatus Firestonebacteria bacterium]